MKGLGHNHPGLFSVMVCFTAVYEQINLLNRESTNKPYQQWHCYAYAIECTGVFVF